MFFVIHFGYKGWYNLVFNLFLAEWTASIAGELSASIGTSYKELLGSKPCKAARLLWHSFSLGKIWQMCKGGPPIKFPLIRTGQPKCYTWTVKGMCRCSYELIYTCTCLTSKRYCLLLIFGQDYFDTNLYIIWCSFNHLRLEGFWWRTKVS